MVGAPLPVLFHPTSVACSEEDNLPAGLCAPGKLWEDRNSTGSGAPTITIPKTRTRQPVRKPTRNRVKEPFQNFPAGVNEKLKREINSTPFCLPRMERRGGWPWNVCL